MRIKSAPLLDAPAVQCSPRLQDLIAQSIEQLGVQVFRLASGAGHDAAVFANAGIPSAMVFVRNENGSHNPKEAMNLDDFVAGIAVMRAAIEEAIL